jgi:hypothetical protein
MANKDYRVNPSAIWCVRGVFTPAVSLGDVMMLLSSPMNFVTFRKK